MVPGHACVAASVRLGDVADTQSPVLRHGLSEEADFKDTLGAHPRPIPPF